MVGDSNIVSSNSARDLGVIFDKCIRLVYLDFHKFRLHCLTCIGYIITFKICILTYQAYLRTAPSYLMVI